MNSMKLALYVKISTIVTEKKIHVEMAFAQTQMEDLNVSVMKDFTMATI